MHVTDMGMLYTGNYFFVEIGKKYTLENEVLKSTFCLALHFQFASHTVFILVLISTIFSGMC